tara:strand:- start:2823 stop:3092 length:270 start_codon:yes stop_codon:yes gene_type:complete
MFKDLIKQGKHVNMGFPIAEVEYDGTVIISKEKDTGGKLTGLRIVHTLTFAQDVLLLAHVHRSCYTRFKDRYITTATSQLICKTSRWSR